MVVHLTSEVSTKSLIDCPQTQSHLPRAVFQFKLIKANRKAAKLFSAAK